MLLSVILQGASGTIRRIAAYETIHHRNEIGEILSSGWFWGIVGFILLCVIVYAIVKDKE